MLSRDEKRNRRPARIELGDEELAITWPDGRQSRYGLKDLRLACPCAVCCQMRGQPHGPQLVATELGVELPLITAASVDPTGAATGFEPVGRYGIKIRWADGHDAGIYTFEMLRDLG